MYLMAKVLILQGVAVPYMLRLKRHQDRKITTRNLSNSLGTNYFLCMKVIVHPTKVFETDNFVSPCFL